LERSGVPRAEIEALFQLSSLNDAAAKGWESRAPRSGKSPKKSHGVPFSPTPGEHQYRTQIQAAQSVACHHCGAEWR
jgi:hypothetical protein